MMLNSGRRIAIDLKVVMADQKKRFYIAHDNLSHQRSSCVSCFKCVYKLQELLLCYLKVPGKAFAASKSRILIALGALKHCPSHAPAE